MRLVVCVDRDDDLGRKAGIAGPIVGRDRVLDAATRLGMADPEDSDTNALFAAIGLLDELRRTEEPCEVVVLTGAAQVGLVSDRRVAEQFDKVLVELSAKSAFLVSDGAEDEYLYPILASRVRIDGVRRVYIRQSASLESTYYTLVRALKDPKLRAKTVLPLAMVLLTLGLAAALGVIGYGIIGIVILLGVYLVFWTFDIDEAIIDSVRSASTDIRQGSVAFGFGLFAMALVGLGFLSGYNVSVAIPRDPPIDKVLLFTQAGLVFWVFGAFVWESGRAIRRYFSRGRFPRSYLVATVSIGGTGLLSYGIVFTVEYLEALIAPATLPLVISTLVAGFALIIGAGVLQQYLRARTVADDRAATSAPH
jgi:putative membrane protein